MSLASIVCVPIFILGVSYTPASSSAPVSQGQGGGQSTYSASFLAIQKAQAWRASWLVRRANGFGFSQSQQMGTRVGRPAGGYFRDRRIFGHGGGGVLPPVSPEPISRFMP